MKKSKIFISVVAMLLCVSVIFVSCADKPADNTPGGAGGSDISPENSVSATEEHTSSKPKYTADDKLIALTFDDGPSAKATNRILDLLEKHNGTATFFIVGYNIDDNTSVIERTHKMGCEIANHSNDHKNLTKCTASEIRNQVDAPNEKIKALTGVSPKLFRTPGGNFSGVEEEIGMPIIQWSIDTNDWRYKDASNKGRSEAQRNADLKKISDKVINSAESGDIVLMHDIYSFTADLCELIIPGLVEKGFKLVTVSEMYEAYGVEMKNGKVYYSVDVIPASVEPIEIGNYKVKTNGGVLNVRAETDSNSESLAKIPNGTPITVLRSVAGWAYVEYNSIRGWVNAKFLERI